MIEKNNKYNVVIQNVVATSSLGTEIDLIAIMKIFANVEYRPKKFPGLVFRLKNPKTATLIFTTGKMVCTGAKSSKEARRAVRKVVRELKKEGFIIRGKPEIIVHPPCLGGRAHHRLKFGTLNRLIYLNYASLIENTLLSPGYIMPLNGDRFGGDVRGDVPRQDRPRMAYHNPTTG